MNPNPSFRETVLDICTRDTRYQPEAYAFLIEALDATVKGTFKDNPDHGKHVTGAELLEGIRNHALAEFGPMTHAILTDWGIRETIDFGEIVFNLINAGRLSKTDTDTLEDFRDVYSFDKAFAKPFQPKHKFR